MEPEIGPGSLLDEAAAWRRDIRESMTAARNCRSGDAADGLATAASSAGAAGSTRQWRRQLTLIAKTDFVYSPNHCQFTGGYIPVHNRLVLLCVCLTAY
jgi:hypothetical protein